MSLPDSASRREFLLLSGLAVGAAGVSLPSIAQAADPPATIHDPDKALAALLAGNKRFVNGKSRRVRRTPQDFAKDAEGQSPIAAIVGCADSRVSPEIVFDQSVGSLFVVRVAGNVVSGTGPLLKGSIEFAVAELGVRLIIVMGHSQCGAVKAAIEFIDDNDKLPGSIGGLVDLIKPAVEAAKGKPGNNLDNVIRANVERCSDTLETLDPIIKPLVDKKELKVVGAVYELSTGVVTIYE